jgi:hypothetical protein
MVTSPSLSSRVTYMTLWPVSTSWLQRNRHLFTEKRAVVTRIPLVSVYVGHAALAYASHGYFSLRCLRSNSRVSILPRFVFGKRVTLPISTSALF